MFNTKEVAFIILITIILAFVLSFPDPAKTLIFIIPIFFIIVINNVAKKISSFYLDSEIEVKLWELKRSGLLHILNINPFRTTHPSKDFKRPFPIGVFLPIITAVFSFGYFTWLNSLIFDVKAKVYRAAKRFGLYTFSEMTEYHIGLIAASGVLANLFFAIIGYLLNFDEFAKLNIYYAFFNLIPLSELDGNKILFGSIVLWSFLVALVLIGLGYVFLVV